MGESGSIDAAPRGQQDRCAGPAEFSAACRNRRLTRRFSAKIPSLPICSDFQEFYRDEYVLAFPTPAGGASIRDIDEKALYTRGSYSSRFPARTPSAPGYGHSCPAKTDMNPSCRHVCAFAESCEPDRQALAGWHIELECAQEVGRSCDLAAR